MPEQLLKCADCGKKYRTPSYNPDKTYACKRCGGALQAASSSAEPGPAVENGALEHQSPDDLLIGTQIGRYKILAKLGEGGMGAVYKAEHVDLRRLSALKLLPQQKAERSVKAVQRFMREARCAAALEHTNIVTVFNVDEADGWHFIDMQFVDGESVQERLQRDGELRVEEATRIVADAARALAEAHSQGIVHRDIKPANILLDQNDTVRVADFGLAKSTEGEDTLITMEGKGGLGTPLFMSPEQCDGFTLDGRSDIYSLGVTLYYLLTGDVPFNTDGTSSVAYKHRAAPVPDPRKLVSDLPEAVCQVIEKAMAKKPGDRFQSCEELIEGLLAAVEGSAPRALPSRAGTPTRELRGVERAARGLVGIPAWLKGAIAATVLVCLLVWPALRLYLPSRVGIPMESQEASSPSDPTGELVAPGKLSSTDTNGTKGSETVSVPVETAKVDRDQDDEKKPAQDARTPARPTPTPAATGKSFTNEKDGSEMIYIPAGTFKMGGKEKVEGGMVHDVHVDAFYISQYEITNKQFKKFLDADPRWRKDRINKGYHDGGYLKHWQGGSYPSDKADHPVVNVSWFAAKAYCEWAGGRLPIEAQWERACRAGSTGMYCFGDDESELKDYAWYRDNSGDSTHPVGEKKANDLGIHDMHGNVWEWTSSIIKDYPYVPSDGREGVSDNASPRVLRGGSFNCRGSEGCRAALRSGIDRPTHCGSNGGGVRLCVSGDAPSGEPALAKELPQVRPEPTGKSFTNDKDGSEMILVPAGTFKMGSDDGDERNEKPVHDVHLEAFYISKHEVTNSQYREFVDANQGWRRDRIKKEYHNGDYLKRWGGDIYPAGEADHPVVSVSWFAAKAYCEWAGGRLPTEAEWEKACCGGATGRYCFGDDESKLKDYAWYRDNSGRFAHPVGQKKPNAWGIHDMHGNVWEWCSSIYKEYPYRASDGREDLSDTGSRRVVRGGGWNLGIARRCRSATRVSNSPTRCVDGNGFRVVVSARAPSASATPHSPTKEPERTVSQAPPEATGKSFTNDKDGSEMIYVPAGTFKMGGKESYEGGMVHDVHVDAFYISKYEITSKQFKRFLEANPEWRKGRVDKKLVEDDYLKHWEGESYPSDKADHPVVNVSWFAAKAYCEWASSGGLRGRLPTEAEWEYACRAGSTGKYCFGDDQSKLKDYGWYIHNLERSTHPVGQKKANAWGIHDMHGNVWEWTGSKPEPYPYRANDGREDLSDTGSRRVVRGGSWGASGRFVSLCRSAYRNVMFTPTFCIHGFGFRLVLSARAPVSPSTPESLRTPPERKTQGAPSEATGKSFTNDKDGSEMIYVPAGTLKMGSDDGLSCEKPVHDVQVDVFYISKYEITNKQFKQFVDANPEWRKGRVDSKLVEDDYLEHWEGDTYPSDKADHPVVYVSWFAAKAYCEWASSGELDGRLPTEAEWEKACRAGSIGKYCFGDDESKLKDYGWYKDNSKGSTHPVGQKRANAWGIHDMHGNVYEWTSSIYRDYPYKANDGGEDPNDTGSRRVVRGGGHGSNAHFCGSADRSCHYFFLSSPSLCNDGVGFRVVVSARAPN